MEFIVSRNPRTAWRKYQENTLIITPDDRQVHKLNETGSLIWEFIMEGPKNLIDITKRLSLEFDVKTEDAENDVKKFINAMLSKNIILRNELNND